MDLKRSSMRRGHSLLSAVVLLTMCLSTAHPQWTQTSLYASISSMATIDTSLFAGSLSMGVYLSPNRGASWGTVNIGLTNGTVNCLAASGSFLYAGTLGGVFVTEDLGGGWTTTGLPYPLVNTLAICGNRLYAGTNGAGVYVSANGTG
jgi:hypothetical protein